MKENLTPEEGAKLPPTIVVSIDEDNDIKVETLPGQNIDVIMALSMLELAKQKMVAAFYQNVQQTRAKTAMTKPQILVPR